MDPHDQNQILGPRSTPQFPPHASVSQHSQNASLASHPIPPASLGALHAQIYPTYQSQQQQQQQHHHHNQYPLQFPRIQAPLQHQHQHHQQQHQQQQRQQPVFQHGHSMQPRTDISQSLYFQPNTTTTPVTNAPLTETSTYAFSQTTLGQVVYQSPVLGASSVTRPSIQACTRAFSSNPLLNLTSSSTKGIAESDDAVVPPARAQSTPEFAEPYPPNRQSRSLARETRAFHRAVNSASGTPAIRRPNHSPNFASAPSAPSVSSSTNPLSSREETSLVRRVFAHPSSTLAGVSSSHPNLSSFASRNTNTTPSRLENEVTLPPQPPAVIYDPSTLPFGNNDSQDVEMTGQNNDDFGYEVTLNIDVPKTTGCAEGKPKITVVNAHPSWYCIFIESIHHQRVQAAVRIQFCAKVPKSIQDGLDRVRGLQTIQVVGYESQQVEMSQKIVGDRLLERGGVIVHLDPAVISYNKDASFGFTLSLSSLPLTMLTATRDDVLLPVQKQRRAAFCRRNLKEMYYDNASKDVAIFVMKPRSQAHSTSSSFSPPSSRLSPSSSSTRDNGRQQSQVLEVFYAHSVILESFSYFRARYETATVARDQAIAAAFASADEGFARPLREQMLMQQQQQQQPHQYVQQAHGACATSSAPNMASFSSFSAASSSSASVLSIPLPPFAQSQSNPQADPRQDPQQRQTAAERIQLCLENVSPNVFRAVLHFMYMGQVPTVASGSSAERVATSTTTTVTSPGSATATSGTMVQSPRQESRSAGSSSTSAIHAPHEAPFVPTTTLAQPDPSNRSEPVLSHSPRLHPGTSMVESPCQIGSRTTTNSNGNSSGDGNGNGSGTGNRNHNHTQTNTTATRSSSPPAHSTLEASSSKDPLDFSWKDVYEASIMFELQELTHMASLALVSGLQPETVLKELFEWVYRFEKLVPLYVDYVVRHVPCQLLENSRQRLVSGRGNNGLATANGGSGRSALWQYRNLPGYEKIVQALLRALAKEE
ncbi:hypothetical protein BG004_006456 [Podila humilis]|nr:hypothetical protein BG004_006456 [Podila humilis]